MDRKIPGIYFRVCRQPATKLYYYYYSVLSSNDSAVLSS